jgi:hypothetical protein
MRKIVALICLAVLVSAANAAELPTREAKPPQARAKRCEVAGQPGILTADGQTCIRVSGYIGSQVGVGNLK